MIDEMMFFIIIAAIEFIILLIVTHYFIKMSRMTLDTIEQVESLRDAVEESLDTLDASYRSIAEVADMDVISNEPFVKRVVEAIKSARDSIHAIAVAIASQFEEEQEEE